MVSRFPHRTGDDVDEPVVEACRRKHQDRWRCRRLLQRQLHDGAALRISALTLRLGLIEHRAAPDGQAMQDCIGELQDEGLEQLVRDKIGEKLQAASDDVEAYATAR